jgi:pseudouridine synthase
VGSRRACEQFIAEGRVQVNGHPHTTQGHCIDLDQDQVLFDGHPVRTETLEYYLFNKPRDVLCTCRDPGERRTFRDFVPDPEQRLFPVGRLDRNSEGLLILTNDGQFSHALIHPRHQVPKYYEVWVDARLPEPECRRMIDGIWDEGELLQAAEVALIGRGEHRYGYEITLFSGRNRQIRRMIAALGHEVIALKRVAIGPLTTDGLRVGQWRRLTRREVAMLMAPVQQTGHRTTEAGRSGPETRSPAGRNEEAPNEAVRNNSMGNRDRGTVRRDGGGGRRRTEGERRPRQSAGPSRL